MVMENAAKLSHAIQDSTALTTVSRLPVDVFHVKKEHSRTLHPRVNVLDAKPVLPVRFDFNVVVLQKEFALLVHQELTSPMLVLGTPHAWLVQNVLLVKRELSVKEEYPDDVRNPNSHGLII
jgi:hypothetical protein